MAEGLCQGLRNRKVITLITGRVVVMKRSYFWVLGAIVIFGAVCSYNLFGEKESETDLVKTNDTGIVETSKDDRKDDTQKGSEADVPDTVNSGEMIEKEDSIEYTLPKGLEKSGLLANMGSSTAIEGRVFVGEAERKKGVYGAWYSMANSASGGMMRDWLGEDAVHGLPNFPGSLADYDGNGMGAVDGLIRYYHDGECLEEIAIDGGKASIQKIEITSEALIGDFCWYISPADGNAELTDEMRDEVLPRTLWLASVKFKNEEQGYCFYLDAKRYKKRDLVDLVKSIHIKN